MPACESHMISNDKSVTTELKILRIKKCVFFIGFREYRPYNMSRVAAVVYNIMYFTRSINGRRTVYSVVFVCRPSEYAIRYRYTYAAFFFPDSLYVGPRANFLPSPRRPRPPLITSFLRHGHCFQSPFATVAFKRDRAHHTPSYAPGAARKTRARAYTLGTLAAVNGSVSGINHCRIFGIRIFSARTHALSILLAESSPLHPPSSYDPSRLMWLHPSCFDHRCSFLWPYKKKKYIY